MSPNDNLIEEWKKVFDKPVSFVKIHGITQGAEKNLALFQGLLLEAILTYTNLDSISPEGTVRLCMHFISQLEPDIHWKLTRVTLGPQTPTQHVLKFITGVFNNRRF